MLYFTDIKVFPHLLLGFIRYWQTREGKTRCLWSAVRRRAHWTPQRLSKLPKNIQYIKVRNRSQGFAFLVHCSFHMAPSLGSLFLSDSGHFLPLTTSCIAHSHWGQLKSSGQPGSFPELFPLSQLHANESFLFGLFSTNKWIENMQIPKQWQWRPTPVLLPGKSHGWRRLVGCGLWGSEVSDTTEWLHFHFSLSCIEEGNGNPLQCSRLQNPREGGAWWAVLYGVSQSRTQLKRLSSSSSSSKQIFLELGHQG